MPESAGLQTNLTTWLVMALLFACWLGSLRLLPEWKRDGWVALLRSLYGFCWLSFGLDIVLRFCMLAYNAVEWGNGTARLVSLPVETVNAGLEYCLLFWVTVSSGYAVALRLTGNRVASSGVGGSAGPFELTRVFTVEFAYAAAIPMAVFSSLVFYAVGVVGLVPLPIVTPLALLATLYFVPATIVWWDHFQRPGPWWRIRAMQVIVLVPALVSAWRNPYRESLAPLVLVPLIAALFAGRRPALRVALPVALVCFMLATTLISSYRAITWENTRPEEVAAEMHRAGVVEWLTGDFGERMARFHSFDSILLTVHLVPRARAFSGRSLLVSPFIRAVVPRAVNAGKAAADAGVKFGATIWAYDDPSQRDHGGAAIAPSMPGDLYDAGGAWYIALGGMIWGALLGLVDGWKANLPGYMAAALTALVSTHCAMSVERDFDHEVAGMIQIYLVLVAVAGVMMLARRRRADTAPSSYALAYVPVVANTYLHSGAYSASHSANQSDWYLTSPGPRSTSHLADGPSLERF